VSLQPGEVADTTISLTLPGGPPGGPIPAYENDRGAMTIGQVVEGSLHPLGGRDIYHFALTGPMFLYFDSLVNSQSVRWTLGGPAGTAVNDQFFSGPTGSGGWVGADGLLGLPAGDYTFTVAGAGPYQFRLLDLAQATSVAPGTPISGTLDPADSTNLYRFDAQPGDRFAFHVQDRDGAPHASWRLVGPAGNILFRTTLGYDVGTLTLRVAGSYTLAVEGDIADTGTGHYTLDVEPRGHEPPAPIAGTPLTLGSIIDGAIATPGEQQRYTFTLARPSRLYFDSLTNDAHLNWTLEGPAGTAVSDRAFSSDGLVPPAYLALGLATGNYVLTVAGLGNNTGAYRFRLLDLAQATPLALGKPVDDVLDPADSTNAYRFDARASDRLFLDVQALDGAPSAQWELVDPYGNSLFDQYFRKDERERPTLPETGTYTLLVEGHAGDTIAGRYTLIVQSVPAPTEALTPGGVVDGAIDVPTEQRRYTFTLADPTKLYFDALTNDSRFVWTLAGPGGNVVSNRAFTASDGTYSTDPVQEVVAGDYTLTVSAAGDATGAYQFRLLDLSQATLLTPSTQVSDVLDPGNSTNAYRLDARAGDRVFFDLQASNRDSIPIPSWRLVGPDRNILFSAPFYSDVGPLTLSVSGAYTLLVEGAINHVGTDGYTFTAWSTPVPTEPLIPGGTVSGAIDVPGAQRRYTFALANPSRLYFDALTWNSSLAWTLEGPAGTVISHHSFSGSDPLLDLRAGATP
jgi:hypothetical protein